MHEQPRRILCELLNQHGQALHTDARRTEAFLRDLCAAYPREVFVLVHAQRARVPADLLAAPAWMPQELLRSQLVRRLQENLALTPEAAEWAVESWAAALQVGPNPSDRVWVWIKQNSPSRQTLATQRRQLQQLPPIVTRLFHQAVLQWPTALTVPHNLRNRIDRLSGWLWERRRALVRPPVVALWAGLLSLSMLLSSVPPSEAFQTIPLTGSLLVLAYPLPRSAWVSEEQLAIRAGPSTDYAELGRMNLAQEVTVVEFSANGGWSHIWLPQDGWISNNYVRFQSEGPPSVFTRLELAHAQSTASDLNVRRGPSLEHAIVGSLQEGEAVIVVAHSEDGAWKQIILPEPGWVSSHWLTTSLVEVQQR
jgi:uncharacterized protein YraI